MTRKGFTLIELLVVIAIIGILTAILAPVTSSAKEQAANATCKSNLRQLALLASTYHSDHGTFPPSQVYDMDSREQQTWEDVLMSTGTDSRSFQCPSFKGEANWGDDEFTGYNYNASFIGGYRVHKNGEDQPWSQHSTTMAQIRNPATCAMFGDGEYESGANKFMRSPRKGHFDLDAGAAVAGTQGFRHDRKTNIVFADGHVSAFSEIFKESGGFGTPAANCGFISKDNSLYDLD